MSWNTVSPSPCLLCGKEPALNRPERASLSRLCLEHGNMFGKAKECERSDYWAFRGMDLPTEREAARKKAKVAFMDFVRRIQAETLNAGNGT